MNCAELFNLKEREHGDKLALWLPNGSSATFSELKALGASTQRIMRGYGVGAGDTVLLFEPLGPRLYGAVLGLMAMGVGVALVEPWMPVEKINHVLSFITPKAFLSHPIGQLWGARVKAIRRIPNWIRSTSIIEEPGAQLHVADVDGNTPGIITFTSGTTGNPKGMVRTQQYLADQHRILSSALEADSITGPDLCIFANFVFSNLAAGRTSIVCPPGWKTSHLKAIDSLPDELQPESLTCGPAFLLRLLESATLRNLRSVHVGGALTDCDILEAGFAKWPKAHWSHLYGSTEVEPVAIGDARLAVKQSREKGHFQTLFLGSPIPDIAARFTPETVWVTGPHVCPRYLANDEENRKYKETDEKGNIWHRMGDRIALDNDAWWYAGRENQAAGDFMMEQKLYTVLGSSAAFIHTGKDGSKVVYCQRAKERAPIIREAFPDVRGVVETTIKRDRRHRARIDRMASLKAAGRHAWTVG